MQLPGPGDQSFCWTGRQAGKDSLLKCKSWKHLT